MPTVTRPVRALAAACLVIATLLGVTPGPASALEPPRPLPHYHPAFVTETDARPWNDCLWASGAMLLDKWTNGRLIVTHQRLRALSGDRVKGSMFPDLKVAYAKLGIDLVYSPDGGTRITWAGLLKRLANGAGAVLLGDDSRLPRWYGRWDHGFWKAKGKKDNHAVYVERYDRRHGRVWLMDPLGRGDWNGEWISVSALQRFTWSRGGALYAAVTPTAKAAPFAGVSTRGLQLTATSTTLDAAWSLKAPRHWRYPGTDISAAFHRADDPVLAAVTSLPVIGRVDTGAHPARASASVTGRSLRLTVPLPGNPGAYTTSLRLTDRRFGRIVARSAPIATFIAGPRHASLRLHAPARAIEAGAAIDVSVSVANSGSLAWTNPPPWLVEAGKATARNTRLVARWIPLGPSDAGGVTDVDAVVPDPFVLDRVPLAPGRRVVVDASVVVPDALGRWALAIDVVDDVDGSLAAQGSTPAFQVFNVVVPRGIDALD
jgi:hypothetical protein